MERELICIVCPNGCRLKVDDDMNVTGNRCPRGVSYAKSELTNPVRTLTTSVKVTGSNLLRVCPVKTANPIPKGKIYDAMTEVNKVVVAVPVKMGQVIIPDVCGTGVDIVACRSIEE